jgi:hypothetical protein
MGDQKTSQWPIQLKYSKKEIDIHLAKKRGMGRNGPAFIVIEFQMVKSMNENVFGRSGKIPE